MSLQELESLLFWNNTSSLFNFYILLYASKVQMSLIDVNIKIYKKFFSLGDSVCV